VGVIGFVLSEVSETLNGEEIEKRSQDSDSRTV